MTQFLFRNYPQILYRVRGNHVGLWATGLTRRARCLCFPVAQPPHELVDRDNGADFPFHECHVMRWGKRRLPEYILHKKTPRLVLAGVRGYYSLNYKIPCQSPVIYGWCLHEVNASKVRTRKQTDGSLNWRKNRSESRWFRMFFKSKTRQRQPDTNRQTYRLIDKHITPSVDRETQTDCQTDWWTDRQTNRQTGRSTIS